jgi:chemotaxis protein MotA
MSLTTILAILACFGLIFGSIFHLTSNPIIFIDVAGFMLVIGGTLAATFISYEARYVILSLKLIGRIVFSPKVGREILRSEVGRVIKWAYMVQKGGLPALEAEAGRAVSGDKFLQFGIEMVISGYSGAEVRDILTNSIENSFARNVVPSNILKAMGAAGPAFGMVGTLIGLIIMLDGMGSDPSSLGKGMAVALCATLYGVVAARMVFLPTASKVLQREQIIRFRNYLIAEGLALLADRKSPRYIQDRMNSYLDPAIHFNIDKMRSGS